MGPVDEPRCWPSSCTAVVLYQGAEVPAYEDQPPVVGAVAAGLAGGAGRHPARRPHRRRWPIAPSTPGSSSSSRSARGPNRERRHRRRCATAPSRRVRLTPVAARARAASRSATSACCRTCTRTSASVESGRAGRARRASRPGDIILAVNGEPMTFRDAAAARRSRSIPSKPITLSIRARRRAARRCTVDAGAARRRSGWLGIQIGDETKSIKPGPFEALQHERRAATSRSPGLIFQTLWGLLTRETSPQAADGAGRHRAAVRRVGAARLDRALQPDGVDQPQPRAAQPAADSGARRRAHLHHGARGRGAPRLQHEGQGEDAAGRLRGADDADGDGHLQRPHAHQLDRTADALALRTRRLPQSLCA